MNKVFKSSTSLFNLNNISFCFISSSYILITGEVSQSCLKAIQDKVEKYGIIIEDFNLTDFSFSEEYTKAIEDKQVAEQNLEKSKLWLGLR
mgnify:CR=1 FL=1